MNSLDDRVDTILTLVSTDNQVFEINVEDLKICDFLIKMHNGENHTMEAIPHLLKKEYSYYKELINSSYFYNI